MDSITKYYLMSLLVIQPARVQDVERYIVNNTNLMSVDSNLKSKIREVHNNLRRSKAIFPVRKGSYCINQTLAMKLRNSSVRKNVLNQRFFQLKADRKKI